MIGSLYINRYITIDLHSSDDRYAVQKVMAALIKSLSVRTKVYGKVWHNGFTLLIYHFNGTLDELDNVSRKVRRLSRGRPRFGIRREVAGDGRNLGSG